MVGAYPKCGSENTYDCDNPLELIITDSTVGYCLDCETYWCLVCGYEFQTVGKGVCCPHWDICDRCSKEHCYLDFGTFVEKICPICEYYDNSCQLEDSSECDKERQYICPYDHNVSECPEIQEFFEEQM